MSGPHAIVDNPSPAAAPPPGGSGRSYLAFGRSAVVPAGGSLQLQSAGNVLVGKRIVEAGNIVGLSIEVGVVDATRAYMLDVRVNGVSVATIALPVSTLGAQAAVGPIAVVAGDLVTAFLVKTAGAGASTFSTINAQVEVEI
jgi:hypothetical protein